MYGKYWGEESMAKSIFITGATSGIGRKMAEMCIQKGYTVYATGRNESSLKTLHSLGAHVMQGDMRKIEDIERIVEALPPIDVVILNAGLGIFDNVFDLTDEQIDTMFETNVRAPIYLTKRLAAKMIEQDRGGHFIYVSSQAGKVATRKASVYASTKHAVTGFLNGARLELAPYGIHVTGIYPGPIDTPFLDKADATNAYRTAVGMFLIQPEKVAQATLRCIERPVREINLPRIMNYTAKFYAVAPRLVETIGRSFFNKK